jgi:hypothetical protein
MFKHRTALDRRTFLKTGLAVACGAGMVSNVVGTGNAETADDWRTLSMTAPTGTPYETSSYTIFLDSCDIRETPSFEPSDGGSPLFIGGCVVYGDVTEGDYDAVQYNRDVRVDYIQVDGYVEISMQPGLPEPVYPDQTVRLTIRGYGDNESLYSIDMTGPTTAGTDLEEGEDFEGAIEGSVSNDDVDRYTATGQFARVRINGSVSIKAERQ